MQSTTNNLASSLSSLPAESDALGGAYATFQSSRSLTSLGDAVCAGIIDDFDPGDVYRVYAYGLDNETFHAIAHADGRHTVSAGSESATLECLEDAERWLFARRNTRPAPRTDIVMTGTVLATVQGRAPLPAWVDPDDDITDLDLDDDELTALIGGVSHTVPMSLRLSSSCEANRAYVIDTSLVGLSDSGEHVERQAPVTPSGSHTIFPPDTFADPHVRLVEADGDAVDHLLHRIATIGELRALEASIPVEHFIIRAEVWATRVSASGCPDQPFALVTPILTRPDRDLPTVFEDAYLIATCLRSAL